jgi:hypothetical protein
MSNSPNPLASYNPIKNSPAGTSFSFIPTEFVNSTGWPNTAAVSA